MRAVVVAVQLPTETDDERTASLVQLERLASTLGIEVVDREVQKRSRPERSTYLGAGKLEELGARCASRDADDADDADDVDDAIDLVIVDGDLTPRQHRELTRAVGVEVVDRTGLILEIFESRARTRQALIEVEIARLRYELPRQRDNLGKADRRGGGGRGERGNTHVALGKERIRDRIAALGKELGGAQAATVASRERRDDVYTVALVGYTNAGKSSLMRALTGSEVYVEDQLFATLGTTVRRLADAPKPPIVIADTVGFIKDLPHELVASFQSTLDEALDAQLMLVVVDASDPDWRDQLEVTQSTLDAIGASPHLRRVVLNKVDRVDADARVSLADEAPDAIQISAHDPDDVQRLRDDVVAIRERGLCEESLLVPFESGHLRAEIFEHAHVLEEHHTEWGTVLRVRARDRQIDRWDRSLAPGSQDWDEPILVSDLVDTLWKHGLELTIDSSKIEESGLDFLVAHARDAEENRWIVRCARREAVIHASRIEGRALRLVRDRLPVAVPQWHLQTHGVIAYPLVAGTPGWTLDDAGEASFHVDPAVPPDRWLQSLGETLAALQAIPIADVTAAGLPVLTIDDERDRRRVRMLATRAVLRPHDEMWARWEQWLDSDAGWPQHAKLVHGDLHPGHLLVDDDHALVGILDWTEVHVGDPAIDLITCFGCYGEQALEEVIESFAAAGGLVWPGLIEHVQSLWRFTPVEIAHWAMSTNNAAVLESARTQLETLSSSP